MFWSIPFPSQFFSSTGFPADRSLRCRHDEIVVCFFPMKCPAPTHASHKQTNEPSQGAKVLGQLHRLPSRFIGVLAVSSVLTMACRFDPLATTHETSPDGATADVMTPGDGGPQGDADRTCGDGILSGGEECDGSNLGGMTCQDLGFDSGVLACDAECHLDPPPEMITITLQ